MHYYIYNLLQKGTMDKEVVEKLIASYVRPVYGFALKRCKSMEDAEDLSQEIIMKAFRTLMLRDDIEEIGKYIWTIANHTLSNYYRDHDKHGVETPMEELEKLLGEYNSDFERDIIMQETVKKLQCEIGYLSKLQRRIVIAFYYENKKIRDIATELAIPEGTVKWHLFEAKKELKKGMSIMRTASELKFNPIKFDICGTNGRVGTKGGSGEFFRSALSQNIVFAVWQEAKTVNEIADDLGVSPVYVEGEAEFLEEYGFLSKKGDKYLCNVLLDVISSEVIEQMNTMYEKTAKLFANELYDTLIKSGVLQNEKLYGGCTSELSLSDEQEKDINFFLWALIPYIIARSGEHLRDKTIPFERAATIRPDGGHNLCQVGIFDPEAGKPKHMDKMLQLSGPCWNKKENVTLWQIDSEWSERRIDGTYEMEADRILDLLCHMVDGDTLSKVEYAYLAEKGIIRSIGNPDEMFKIAMQGVWIHGEELNKELIGIGDRMKEKYQSVFAELKKPYAEALLKNTPKHLHIMQRYVLQYTFHADCWFLLYCMQELVNSGKLKLPTEDQKKALCTIVVIEE